VLSPLLVESITPLNNSVEAKLNTPIRMTFTKHVTESTLQGNIRLRKTNGELLPVTLEYVHVTKTCAVRYQNLLESNTEYTIEIIGGPTGIKAIDGSPMIGKSFQFRTITEIVLSPPRLQPIAQVGYFLAPTWLAPTVVEGAETLRYEIKLSKNPSPSAPALWPDASSQMVITSTTAAIPYQVEPETQYFVHVRSLLKEEQSEWATETIFTQRLNSSTPPGPILGAPQLLVLDHNPPHEFIGQVNQIDILFSQPITSTDPENYVYIVEKEHKTGLSKLDFVKGYGENFKIPATVAKDATNHDIVSLVPTNPLAEDKHYTVIVKSGLEGEESSLSQAYFFGFTTKIINVYGNIANVKELASGVSSTTSDSFIRQLMSQYSSYAYEIWSNGNAFNPDEDDPSNVPFYIGRYVELKTAVNLVLSKSLSASEKEVVRLSELSIEQSGNSKSLPTIRELEKEIEDLENMIINGLTKKKRASPVFAQRGSEIEPYPTFMTGRGTSKSFGE
jgi:hypothetical protein